MIFRGRTLLQSQQQSVDDAGRSVNCNMRETDNHHRSATIKAQLGALVVSCPQGNNSQTGGSVLCGAASR